MSKDPIGLYVDKTASAVTDYVIVERNQNTKTPVLVSPAVKIDPRNIPIIPKVPYDFSCLRWFEGGLVLIESESIFMDKLILKLMFEYRWYTTFFLFLFTLF